MEQGRKQDPDAEERTEVPTDEDASHEVMNLLSEHVPLALLADLALPEGPASPTILSEEGLPEVAWWEASDDRPQGADEAPEGAAPST